MNETDIRKYAGLMEELGLTGLEITEDNKVVRLERTAPTAVKENVTAQPPVAVAVESEQCAAALPKIRVSFKHNSL